MVRRTRVRVPLVVAVVVAALATTLVVATISTDSLFGRHTRLPAEHLTGTGVPRRPRLPAPETSTVLDWVGGVLAFLFLVGIIVLILFARGERRRARERLPYEEDELDDDGEWEALITAELATAAAEQLDRLQHGSPRNAIVACWMRLQEATTRAGMPSQPWETSQEYTVRALRRLKLDATAITTLNALYREARFSDHDMGERHRDQAIGSLHVLAATLPGGPASALAAKAPADSLSP